MRILLGLWHPAHVHTFRNTVWKLEEDGHDIRIVITYKDITRNLLDLYNIKYEVIGESHPKIWEKGLDLLQLEYQLIKIAHEFQPDLFLGRGSAAMAHVSKLLRIPYIAFIDSEPVWVTAPVIFPFMDVVLTPTAYSRKLNPKKHIKIDTYKELAYLHPDQFQPDPSVLDIVGISEKEKFAIVRFVGWNAYHDVGQFGLSADEKYQLIDRLSRHCQVYISSEKPLPKELQQYELKIPSHLIHHLLYYASLFVGDSQTMATEAAILGTPAVRYNSFVGKNDMSNFKELEDKYGLLHNFDNFDGALQKAESMLINNDTKNEWLKKREILLRDKIDLTKFLVWFIENYPRSFTEMKEHPKAQYSSASIPGDAS